MPFCDHNSDVSLTVCVLSVKSYFLILLPQRGEVRSFSLPILGHTFKKGKTFDIQGEFRFLIWQWQLDSLSVGPGEACISMLDKIRPQWHWAHSRQAWWEWFNWSLKCLSLYFVWAGRTIPFGVRWKRLQSCSSSSRSVHFDTNRSEFKYFQVYGDGCWDLIARCYFFSKIPNVVRWIITKTVRYFKVMLLLFASG